MVFDIVPNIKQQKMNCQTNPETRKQIGHPQLTTQIQTKSHTFPNDF